MLLHIEVRKDGSPGRVDVLQDPGMGFGEAARNCAIANARFEPPIDVDGNPTTTTVRVHVRFRR